jgi:hypothetical protein
VLYSNNSCFDSITPSSQHCLFKDNLGKNHNLTIARRRSKAKVVIQFVDGNKDACDWLSAFPSATDELTNTPAASFARQFIEESAIQIIDQAA